MLQQSFTLASGLVLKNRLLFAPISTLASSISGQVTDEELEFYKLRTGQVGAIVIASAYISPSGKAYENGLSVSNNAYLPSLKKLASAIKKNGTKAILQIYHGGTMTRFMGGKEPVFCVSKSALDYDSDNYKELSDEDILVILEDYKAAIKRSLVAGFDGVEIHAANSYLPKQFYSLIWNQRDDRWGGTEKNRFRFLTRLISDGSEIIKKSNRPDFALGIRLSVEDGSSNRLSIEESYRETKLLIKHLSTCPVDYIHLASDNVLKEMTDSAGNRVDLLPDLKKVAKGVPIIACGNLYQLGELEKALHEAELVSACRPFVLNPLWANQVLGDGSVSKLPEQLTPEVRETCKIPRNLWGSVKESQTWYQYK